MENLFIKYDGNIKTFFDGIANTTEGNTVVIDGEAALSSFALLTLSDVAERKGFRFVYNNGEWVDLLKGVRAIDLKKLKVEYEADAYFYQMGDVVEKYSKEICRDIIDDNETAQLMSYMMRECIRNSPEHGETFHVKYRIFIDNVSHTVDFAASDNGKGILASLRSNPFHAKYIEENDDALRWAIRPGISKAFNPAFGPRRDGDVWANSGFGLYMVSSICKKLGGEFYLSSCGDCLTLIDGNVDIVSSVDTSYVVGFKIPFIGKIKAAGIITETARDGEAEAKKIKTAFKQASKPSKGLLDT